MDWLKELSAEELDSVLSGDLALIYSECGIDTLIKICKSLMGISLYISARSIHDARAMYIKKHYNGENIKDLAIKLGVSQRYIYKVIKHDKNRN